MTTIPHRPSCDRTAEVTIRPGERGDDIATCTACGRFTFVAREQPQAREIRSPWRCPAHPDQAVTWRGTGCPNCAADLARHRQAKAGRRRTNREDQS